MARIIGLIGVEGSGKDTVAEILGWHRVAFADPLKAMLVALDPPIVLCGPLADLVPSRPLSALIELHGGLEEAKRAEPGVREALRGLGSSAARALGFNPLLEAARREVAPWLATGGRVVVTDVRFPEELAWLRSIGGLVVEVIRPGVHSDGGLGSVELAGQADYQLINDGTLEDLAEQVSGMLEWSHSG